MSTKVFFVDDQISIYCGTPVFTAGVMGGLLNTIVFLSLRTFRENSCAFYLKIMSIFNVLVLVFELLSPVFSALMGSD
jgi:type III secretory pathway component EscS